MFQYEDEIIENIGIKRYEHSIRVMETAVELGKVYDVDLEKLKLAAYFHDALKIRDKDKLLEIAKDYNFKLDFYMEYNLELIHSELSALVCRKKYGILDEEVLNAIKYHTTGRVDMTMVEKIIYIADYIEPFRNHPGVEEIRSLAYTDLDRSIFMAMDSTIRFLIDKNELIHGRTIEARNDLLVKLFKEDFNEGN